MLAWLSFDGFNFSEVISLFDVSVCDIHWAFCKGEGAWVSGACPWEIGVRNLRALHIWGVSWGVDLATLPGLQIKHRLSLPTALSKFFRGWDYTALLKRGWAGPVFTV